MTRPVFQPPVGAWAETPARRMLWASQQVLIYLTKTVPEDPHVEKWTLKLKQDLARPVFKHNWKAWYRHLEKLSEGRFLKHDDDPPLPDAFDKAWAALPDVIKRRLYEQAGQVRTSALGLPFDEQDFERGIQATMHYVTGITDTQKQALRRVLRIAYQESEGPAGFEKRVKQEWAEWSAFKARQVAVTEWNRAASVATRESYIRMGVQYVRWYTAGDDRVCGICEDNAAELEVPINSEFPSGDQTPPAHAGCRCDISSA